MNFADFNRTGIKSKLIFRSGKASDDAYASRNHIAVSKCFVNQKCYYLITNREELSLYDRPKNQFSQFQYTFSSGLGDSDRFHLIYFITTESVCLNCNNDPNKSIPQIPLVLIRNINFHSVKWRLGQVRISSVPVLKTANGVITGALDKLCILFD